MADKNYDLNRQVGEIHTMVKFVLDDLKEHKEIHKDIKDSIEKHNKRINTLEHYKTRVAAYTVVIGGIISYVGHVIAKSFN